MANKTVKTRIQSKHDTEANWDLATGFCPLPGEIIIYDPDANHRLPRIKIGEKKDANTNKPLKDLPFITDDLVDTILAEFNNQISHGTADPSAAITSQYYFKYSE